MGYDTSAASNSPNSQTIEIGDGSGKSKEPVADNYARLGRAGRPPKSPVLYIVNPSTGCWEWQRNKWRGYGRMRHAGKWQAAHRVFYVAAKGEIPEGLQLDHICRNRGCVNPSHLEAVTSAENTRRGDNTKITQDIVDVIRSCSLSIRAIARAFNISASQVSRIKTGRAWGSPSRAAYNRVIRRHARRIGGAK